MIGCNQLILYCHLRKERVLLVKIRHKVTPEVGIELRLCQNCNCEKLLPYGQSQQRITTSLTGKLGRTITSPHSHGTPRPTAFLHFASQIPLIFLP